MKKARPAQASLRTFIATLLPWIGAVSAHAVTIDSFESSTSPSPWIYTNGPEYPGAVGSLTRGTGHTGYGAHLAFDMSNGGNYVGATDCLATPVSAGAIQLWLKNPGGVNIQLRVNDSTGQTLQYSPSRPFAAVDANQWYQLTIELTSTPAHWGGSNDGVLHGGVTSLTIMAQPSFNKVGAVDFDDVALIAAPSHSINPAASTATASAVASFFGSLGVEITHSDTTSTGLNLVQSLGFTRVRTEMFWADVETKLNVYNFSWYDTLVASLRSRGLNAHFILCYGNPIYTGQDWFQPPRTAAAIQGFANFAKAAAAHYAGQDVHFEVWNEEDTAGFWASPSASAYGPMCKQAVAGVHLGDASARVSTGGLAGFDLAFLDGLIANGATNGANAVGIHPYRTQIPENISADLAGLRAHLAALLPTNTPVVWSTEEGYSSAWYGDGTSSADRTTQAKYGVRQLLTGLGVGLPVQILFDLRDVGTDAGDADDNFGVVDANYHTKPLGTALGTLCTMCKTRPFAGMMASPDSTMHIFKFQGSGDAVLVLWLESAPGAARTITFPKAPVQAVSYLGQPVTWTTDGRGNYSVAVTDTPIYVRFTLP